MYELLLLRFLHVVGGVFWGGSVFFFAFFFIPALRLMGPEGSKVMQRVAASGYSTVTAVVAILTILAGLRLYQIDMRGTPGWMMSRVGLAFGIGGLCALIAYVIGLTVWRPSAARMAKLAAALQAPGAAPPTPEQQAEIARLRGRLVTATVAVAWLLVVTVILMAVARYLV